MRNRCIAVAISYSAWGTALSLGPDTISCTSFTSSIGSDSLMALTDTVWLLAYMLMRNAIVGFFRQIINLVLTGLRIWIQTGIIVFRNSIATERKVMCWDIWRLIYRLMVHWRLLVFVECDTTGLLTPWWVLLRLWISEFGVEISATFLPSTIDSPVFDSFQ